MSQSLVGKVALVTGGSRGIGAATARALADDGADSAISYVSSAEKADAVVRELEAKGVRAAAFQADQADPDQVERLIAAVVERFGKLDILVNSAGIAVYGTIDQPTADLAGLQRQQAVNIGGVVAGVRAAVRVMGEGGRIISVGSSIGHRGIAPGLSDYGATKAAVAAYTRGWALDLAPKGITVNAVQPGPIDTDMNPDGTELAESFKHLIPLRRWGKPEEVAAAIAFLAGPGASYITGTTINVDGGQTA
jgi:3-oxoacyl-[acyl-carrier protein] reductase